MRTAPLQSAPPADASPRVVRARASVRTALVNVGLGLLIALSYSRFAPPPASWRAAVFLPAALASSVALLALAPAALLWSASRLAPARVHASVLGALHALVWTAFLVVLFADTRVYGLFRYHFNGMVWNVLTTPGSEDALELSAGTYAGVALAALLVFALEMWAFRRFVAGSVRRARWPRWAGACVLAAFVTERAMYAHADLTRDRSVTALARLCPGYQPTTVKRIAVRWFGFEPAKRARLALGAPGVLLHYPLAEPRLDPARAQPNILVIVADSLRRDLLDPRTMPRLSAFAPRARVFADHLSGGNTTRFGVFSLVYGIHGTYWHAACAEQAPPVLVRALQGAGYEMKVLSAASMSFPEFRSTAWVTAEDSIEDAFQGPKYARDAAIAERFGAWLGERDARAASAPYFAFLLLDSTHMAYSVAPDLTPFRPFVEDVDYLELSGTPTAEHGAQVKNRFLNAVAHVDRVIGSVLDALERRGELDDTLVVITGDHGEEFGEHGFFGHTSNYTLEQVAVTFVMSGPGVEPGVEQRPTSHIDLAPTLLERLGADPSMRPQWSNGANLFDPPPGRTRVLAGWGDVALWSEDAILVAPTEGQRGFVEVFDANWQAHADEDAQLARFSAELVRVARECRLFLR